ncbi:MAG: GTPase HflX [Deltaproteobacteria bacterium]|nr:MAG: GTPase HflX [Deltaproteobacteria bacterium]
MKKVFGRMSGLKTGQIRRIENLYRRKVPPRQIASPLLVKELSRISREIRRQIGVMITRRGKIEIVIVGSRRRIVIPDISEYRTAPDRLKGLRCIHTHLDGKSLTTDDLTDLALLRLDLMAAIDVMPDGTPARVFAAHILPGRKSQSYQHLDPLPPHDLDIGCNDFILAIEAEMATCQAGRDTGSGKETALLVSVSTAPRRIAQNAMTELVELARSNGIEVIDTVLQLRKKVDPRFLLGRGKLFDLAIRALQEGTSLIIFDQELSPSQIRSIADLIELKVIDRTQLILDIFAQRARTREGKLQVELAQLKYMLPRLVTKNTAMSRLTGGIGGRGPGETKLEINRRRVRQRIRALEKALDNVRKHRQQQRIRRRRNQLPIISIIGYTNAGKSTLLNTLTQSHVVAEKRLFATLDPSSRRLRFPQDMEVIITDTVGFIRDLPKELMVAFQATLEELESADLLLHVIDISAPRCEERIEAVNKILSDLSLDTKPEIRVLNKVDRISPDRANHYARTIGGICVSATNRRSLLPLTLKIIATFRKGSP